VWTKKKVKAAGIHWLSNAESILGYIDLSKRRVSPEDIVKCEERYNKSKMVHSIMRHVAEKIKIPIEELYQKIAWPLNKKYGHAIDAFKLSIT
jgi:translation initiation factor 2 subunit 1